MIVQTRTKPSVQPCPPASHLIQNQIVHPGWTETVTTLAIPRLSTLHPADLEPLFHADYSGILTVDIFGHEKRIETLRTETHARGIVSPETALRVRPGTPGGIQVSTVSGTGTFPLFHSGRVIGHVYEDENAKYCMLGDIRVGNPNLSRSLQAAEVLDTMQTALAGAGMDFRDVIRTWFYIDDILDWYDTFNRVRTAFFHKQGIQRIPASTGIGIPNFGDAALVAKAFAVKPKPGGAITVRQVESPLQCEASKYGSSFSRAMEVADPDVRVLYVSGTASILPGGATAYKGDAGMQIDKTMEVVRALLVNGGMELSDTVRGIAYIRHAAHIPLWTKYCRKHKLTRLPIVIAQSTVCREDLLFEIELDAARPIQP